MVVTLSVELIGYFKKDFRVEYTPGSNEINLHGYLPLFTLDRLHHASQQIKMALLLLTNGNDPIYSDGAWVKDTQTIYDEDSLVHYPLSHDKRCIVTLELSRIPSYFLPEQVQWASEGF